MPTEYWYPISAAGHNLPSGNDAWTNSGGANKNASTRPGGGRVGPPTHDDASSYIFTTVYGRNALNIDWPGPMNSYDGVFTAGGRTSATTVTTGRAGEFMNAAGTVNASYFNASGTAWTTHGPIDVSAAATYRPGGGSWVVADFANDQTIFADVAVTGDLGSEVRVTSMFGQISYTPPPGGFVFLLGLAGTLALPHVGRFADFASFRRYLDWRAVYHPRRTQWGPGEDLKAWRDVRAYRWPAYFLPA